MKKTLMITLCVLTAACHSQNNPLGSDEFVPVIHDDSLYVINSRTGDAFRLKDGQRFVVSPYDPDIEKMLEELTADVVRFEAEAGSPSVLKIEGVSKTIGKQPKVRVVFTPYVEPLRELTGIVFWLQFVDSDGFQIGKEAVNASDLTANVDGQGGYLGFSVQKDLAMSQEEYGYVASVHVLWPDRLDTTLAAWLETDAGRQWKKAQESPTVSNESPSAN